MRKNNEFFVVLFFLSVFMLLSFNRFFINYIFFGSILVISVILILVSGLKVRVLKNSYFFILLVLWCFLSIFWSVAPNITFKSVEYLIIVLLLGISFVNRYPKEKIVMILMLYCLLISVLNLGSISFLKDLSLDQDDRYTVYKGLFNHKNNLGKYMAICILVSLWGIFHKLDKKWMVINNITLVCASICLFLSKSSTAISVLLITLIFMIGFRIVKSKKVSIITFVVVFITSIYSIVNMPDWLRFLIQSVFKKDVTFTGRSVIWEVVKEKIYDAPYIGYGYESFWTEEYFVSEMYKYFFFKQAHAHNGFLDLILAIGLIGLMIYIVMVFKFLRNCVSTKIESRYLIISLNLFVFIWMINLLETDLIYPYSMFFLLQFFAFHIVTEE
ncbi:TPA: O-antigen ligase family protein [Bacillus wiedmannii]|nr:O-antigen ligase family protein [Bacillus wiedmannii]